MRNEKMEFDIRAWTIIKIVLVLLTVYFLFLIKDVIALFFVVLVLTATFRPTVNRWEKKIGRIGSIIVLLVLALAILGFIIYVIVPPLVSQFGEFIKALPSIADKFGFLRSYTGMIKNNLSSLTQSAGNLTGSIFTVTSSIIGGIMAAIMAVVLTIYFLLEKNSLTGIVTTIFPDNLQEPILNILKKIEVKVGNWFRGQMLLGLIIGVLHLIVLLVLGVPYALTLAMIAGLLEIMPTIGPIVAGLISAAVALTVSPWIALIAIILFMVIQQLEGAILVPKIMQKAVGLSPIIVLLAVLIGAKLYGIPGALLAIPLTASISVIIHDWHSISRILEAKEN